MDKTIYIITSDPFPTGQAATNRIIAYGKGFLENNASVKVLCLKSTERPDDVVKNFKKKGDYHGIEFEYVCGTTLRGRTFLKRRLLVLIGIINAYRLIVKDRKYITANIMYTDSFCFLFFFYMVSKLLSIKYLSEQSEFPLVLRKTKFSKYLILKIYAKFYTFFTYKLFDGMLIMTNPLISYYKKKSRKNARILQVPITVEAQRFQKTYERKIKTKYIAYCGTLEGDNDGVSILIKAFAIITNKFRDVNLVIIGDSYDSNDLQKLKKLAKDLNVNKKIIFTGRISRDEVPEYICNATILALARPEGLQATGGFPSKVGEYLSTGNPVVVTKVGDIPLFLRDGENSFLTEPNSEKAFAHKIDYILSNYETAKEVGRKGRELALKTFDYNYQAKRILNFIDSLL